MLADVGAPAYITLIENADAGVSIDTFLNKLNVCLDNLLLCKLGLNYENSYRHVCPADIVAIVSEIDVDNQVELTVRNILLNAIINSENLAAGAGIIATIAFLELRKNASCCDDLDILANHTQVTNLKTVKNILKRTFGIDDKIYHMILKTCDIAGHNGRVYVNNIPKDISYIELTPGYKFACHIDKDFEHASKLTKWNRSNVRLFVIDGIIESVSEINHLLEYMSDSKESGMIFARGYSEEVIATLAVNQKRKTLDVVPVIVPYDLQGMNMLKDIAVVCGCDVVSSLKGELISSIDIESIPKIDFVSAAASHVTIEHDSTRRSVDAHLNDLKSRIEDAGQVGDKAKLLNERIKALISNCVEVSLGPEYSKNVSINLHRLESGIRMVAEISRAGIIELSNPHISNPVFSKLLASNYSHISAMAGLHGLQVASGAMELIDTIGAFIIRDR